MSDSNVFLERRANSRVQSRVPVLFRRVEDASEVEALKGKSGQAQDLSLDGIFIQTDKMKIGDVVRMELRVPQKPEALFAFAEVVRVDEAGAGLRLLLMEAEDRELLKDYLDQAHSK